MIGWFFEPLYLLRTGIPAYDQRQSFLGAVGARESDG